MLCRYGNDGEALYEQKVSLAARPSYAEASASMRVGLAGCSGAVTAGRTGQVHGYCVCVRAVE